MPLADPLALLAELVAIPGPPGQESRVADALERHLTTLGMEGRRDAKGNLFVAGEGPLRLVVTAHMDEIAMIVRSVEPDGSLILAPLGGLFPWKLGEIPLTILASDEDLDAALSFGSIHTEAPTAPGVRAKTAPVAWNDARALTGLTADDLKARGVRPGTRVGVHPSVRGLVQPGPLVAGRFLDDRADLVSWLLTLERLGEIPDGVAFVATAAEETGGEGALWFLRERGPVETVLALELSPDVPDAPVALDDRPGVWTADGYAAMSAADGELLAGLGFEFQYQTLSRGGSDASCAASNGLCARPITLGLPMASSHGLEVMHPAAMTRLAEVAAALVPRLLSPLV